MGNNKKVKIYGQEIQIKVEIYDAIHALVSNIEKQPIVKKVDCIERNIINEYYKAKKYNYVSRHSDEYNDMKEKLEEIINEISIPREYTENLKNGFRYMKHVITINNNKYQNDDEWQSEFKEEKQFSDDIMNHISNMCDAEDDIEKYYFYESASNLYHMNR